MLQARHAALRPERIGHASGSRSTGPWKLWLLIECGPAGATEREHSSVMSGRLQWRVIALGILDRRSSSSRHEYAKTVACFEGATCLPSFLTSRARPPNAIEQHF